MAKKKRELSDYDATVLHIKAALKELRVVLNPSAPIVIEDDCDSGENAGSELNTSSASFGSDELRDYERFRSDELLGNKRILLPYKIDVALIQSSQLSFLSLSV